MQRLVIYTAVIGLAGAAGLFTSFFAANQPAPVEISKPVPLADQVAAAAVGPRSDKIDVPMDNLEGGTSSVGDWAGKPRLVNFWATWCAPCLREIPLLRSLQEAQNPPGLQVIGVAHDEMPSVREFALETPFNYPVLVGELEAVAAANSFGVELMALPFTLVISADGELVNAHIGEMDAAEAEEIIAVLGKLESGALTLDAAREALGN